MKIQTPAIVLSFLLVLACNDRVNDSFKGKRDKINFTHKIEFVDSFGQILLILDSSFNSYYSYIGGSCTTSYFRHVLKNKETRPAYEGGWGNSGFTDTVHFLVLSYSADNRDIIAVDTSTSSGKVIKAYNRLKESEKYFDYFIKPRINYFRNVPYLITGIRQTNDTNCRYWELTAAGPITVRLLTNQIDSSQVREYFFSIMSSLSINYKPKAVPFYDDLNILLERADRINLSGSNLR